MDNQNTNISLNSSVTSVISSDSQVLKELNFVLLEQVYSYTELDLQLVPVETPIINFI